MISDPIYDLFQEKDYSFTLFGLVIGIVFGVLFILFNYLYTKKLYKGNENSEYLKDPVGIFLWPILLFAPLTSLYFIVPGIGIRLSNELAKQGEVYNDYRWNLLKYDRLFLIAIVVSLLINFFVGKLQQNDLEKKRAAWKWVKRNSHIWFQIAIFDIPLAYMICMIILGLVDQGIVLSQFFGSGWVPSNLYHLDGFYGLRPIYSIVVVLIAISTYLSLAPAIMFPREAKTKNTKFYKLYMTLGVVCLIIPFLLLALQMDTFLREINETFMESHVFSQLDGHRFDPDSSEAASNELIAVQNYAILLKLPSSFPVPILLVGLILIRLYFLVIDVLIKYPDEKQTLRGITKRFLEYFYDLLGIDIEA